MAACSIHSPTPDKACHVCQRLATEERIVLRTASDLLEAGYSIAVNDGEETTTAYTDDIDTIKAALFTTDEDWLLVEHESMPDSFVRFIYGNSGYDVINDYGVSLEPIMAPINEWCDTLDTRG